MGRVPKVQGQLALTLRRPSRRSIGSLAFAFLLYGCASTFSKRTVTHEDVAIARPATEIAESELLGVRINPFEPGEVKKDEKASLGISKEIRKAEGYYSAVQLKKSMQQSGYWGPVRVVPAEVKGGEVIVTGRILESDGEFLKLHVSVRDATGMEWISKEYDGVVDSKIHKQSERNGAEAFQYLYNRIANDVATARSSKRAEDVRKIRQTEELNFATDFVPEAFAGYLQSSESDSRLTSLFSNAKALVSKDSPSSPRGWTGGIVKIARLPAEDDPMLGRIRRIHAREESFVDTLDLQHDELARKIAQPYTQWRMARLIEMAAIRDLEEKRNAKIGRAVAIGAAGILLSALVAAAGGRNQLYNVSTAPAAGAVAGAAVGAAAQIAMQAEKEANDMTEMHRAALQELGESLATDLQATVVQTEGQTIELRGSAEEKFKQWRDILAKIYQNEAGVPPSGAQPTEDPMGPIDAKAKGA